MHKFQYITSRVSGNGGGTGGNFGTGKDGEAAGNPSEGQGAGRALILLHGRGGSAEDIMSLGEALPVEGYDLFALQATGHSWYPQSFLAPIAQNEPWLSSALDVVGQMVAHVEGLGVAPEKIFFAGFSQGACLMLEYLARHGARFGGAAAFTGGLIGDRIYPEHYHGDFKQMPIFIGTSDPDTHVPVQRVHDSVAQLKSMNAAVTERFYPRMGHTITNTEIGEASRAVFNVF